VNLARTRAIARHEARTQLSSPLLWGLIGAAAFATIAINPAAMIPSGDAAVAGVQPFANSRYALAQILALTGLIFYTLPVGLLAGASVPHDDDARIGDLLHSTLLTASEYIAGKLAGIGAVLGLAMAAHLSMMLGWYEFGGLVGSTNVSGPFALGHYVWPMVLFVAPGAFCVAGVAFAAGERFRSPLAAYASATLLFFVTMMGLIPRSAALDGMLDRVFGLLDLWGARWLSRTVFRADRGIEFYNQAPFEFDGAFLLSRVFALATPIILAILTVRHCRRVIRGAAARPGRRRARGRPSAPSGPHVTLRPANEPLMPPGVRSRPPAVTAAMIAVAKTEWRQLRGQPGLYAFVVFAALLVAESAGSARGVFDSPVILTAGGIAVDLIEVLTTVGCLLLLFLTVEALDRPRRLGIHEILYSTPLPTMSLVVGTQIAGLAIIVGLLSACAGVGVSMLATQPQGRVALWPFALVWGGLLLPTFAFWSALVALLYAVLRHRHLTYLAALVVLAGTAAMLVTGSMTWVWNWPLWGALRWTDIGLFELDPSSLWLNRLTVAGAAVGSTAGAIRWFARTESDRSRAAMARAPGVLARDAVRVLPLAALALIPGSCLARRVADGFQGHEARTAAGQYATLNAAWRDAPTPAISHLSASLRVEPASRRMRVRGEYLVVNRSDDPMPSLAFTVGRGMSDLGWTIDGQAVEARDRTGLHVIALDAPLASSAITRVGFTYVARWPAGATRNGGQLSEFLLPSSLVLSTLSPNFLPLPGFLDADGAAARVPAPFTARLEIDAPAGFIVNGVGRRTSELRSEDRTTVVWESERPVRYLTITGGWWAVEREGDTAVFHHPAHADNAGVMLDTLVAARRRYSEWFHPYPWTALGIAEYANHATRARGFPTIMPFAESMGFLTARGDGAPLPVVVTAHEAAHQWFPHIVMPGNGPGADVLIEGLANYATLLLLEAEFGDDARRAFAAALEANYVRSRRVDLERPLLRTGDGGGDGRAASDETVVFDRGPWVLWMLDRLLTRDRMLAGLRAYAGRYAFSEDRPGLTDFILTLRGQAADTASFDAFVADWVRDVAMPEITIADIDVVRARDEWETSATVTNVGSGTVVLDVAAASPPREARVTARLGPRERTRLSWRTAFEPESLTVDPDLHVLQLNRDRARVVLRHPR
jgi:hypothetical protein